MESCNRKVPWVILVPHGIIEVNKEHIEGKVISWRLNAKVLKGVNILYCSEWISSDEFLGYLKSE